MTSQLKDAPPPTLGTAPSRSSTRTSVQLWDVISSYIALTKPRIIELLLVSTIPTMFLAYQGVPPALLVVCTLVGGALAAGSANALNCYVDRDIDSVMSRTSRRPLPRHTVTPRAALVFGCVLGVVSMVFLAWTTTYLAAGLAVAAIAIYVVGYTVLLKRRTSQNIVWGGAAGCMPVLIGWSAVTGSLSWPAWVLFGVIFFWTPPHYWPLAMKFRDDYAAAGVPMLPVVASKETVARHIVGYSWAMVLCAVLLWPLSTGWVYGASAVALGAVFLREAYALQARVRAERPVNPMRLFRFSITYLTLLFIAVAVDVLVSVYTPL